MKLAKLVTAYAVLTFVGLFSMPASLETVVAQSSNVDFDIALDHVALGVPDIGQSIAWYEKMFGFKEIRRSGQPNGVQTALIQCGDVRIELFQVPRGCTAAGVAPKPVGGFSHTWRQALCLPGEGRSRCPRTIAGQGRESSL